MYSSYTAASFARIYDLAERYHVDLRGAMSWSFEFEKQKWFDGFRDLATNGVDKPVLNVFRMYGMMQGRRIPVDNPSGIPLDSMMKSSVHGGRSDIHALAAAGARQLTVMVWNYTDDALPGDSVDLQVLVTHLPPAKARFRHFRIDETHSNAYEVWKQMGAPSSIEGAAYRRLEKAGALAAMGDTQGVRVPEKGETSASVKLPAHAVSLLRWDW
jgi:xylan 1,4-beta-xylosidase